MAIKFKLKEAFLEYQAKVKDRVTQEQFTELIGISPRIYQLIVSGRTKRLDLDLVQRTAKLLRCNWKTLLIEVPDEELQGQSTEQTE